MQKTLLIALMFWVSLFCHAQDWTDLNNGMTTNVFDFFALNDSALLLLGSFNETVNGLPLDGIAKWNGAQFSTLTSQPANSSWSHSASAALSFNGIPHFVLNALDDFEDIEIPWPGNSRICAYDGNELTFVSPVFPNISEFTTFENQLVIGYAESFFGGASFYLWDGLNLDSVSVNGFIEPLDIFSEVLVQELLEFQGDIYVGGNIQYEDGNIHEVFSWNEQSGIGNLNGGIQGFASNVQIMAVFQEELIIGGLFWQDEGNATNCIVGWDGSSFFPLGEIGANNRVDALKVYGGFLYAGGFFTEMESEPCRIARWDGQSWECFSNSDIDFNNLGQGGAIRDFAFFQDEMYICGGFHTIDGEQVNHVAKYIGPLSLTLDVEEKAELRSTVYPNPVDHYVFIESSKEINTIEIVDSMGRVCEVYEDNVSQLDLREFSSGIYSMKIWYSHYEIPEVHQLVVR